MSLNRMKRWSDMNESFPFHEWKQDNWRDINNNIYLCRIDLIRWNSVVKISKVQESAMMIGIDWYLDGDPFEWIRINWLWMKRTIEHWSEESEKVSSNNTMQYDWVRNGWNKARHLHFTMGLISSISFRKAFERCPIVSPYHQPSFNYIPF